MKFTKVLNILLIVLIVAAFAVVPAFAFDGTPPADAPAFDFAAIAKTLESLIALVLLPSIALLTKYLSVKSKVEFGKLSEQQKISFHIFLRTLVYAAEQMKAKQYIDDRLTWVLERAEEWAFNHNFPINLDGIRIEVEAIIAQELNFSKLTESK